MTCDICGQESDPFICRTCYDKAYALDPALMQQIMFDYLLAILRIATARKLKK